MDIRVTDDDKDYGMSVYKISVKDFGCKEYHPFIATNKWDNAYIDVTDETPRGIIRQLLPIVSVKPVIDFSNISVRMMQIICEIYPDNAARLQQLYRTDLDSFIREVKQLIR